MAPVTSYVLCLVGLVTFAASSAWAKSPSAVLDDLEHEEDSVSEKMLVEAIARQTQSLSSSGLAEESYSPVCYGDLGCFSDHFLGASPSSPEDIDAYFSFNAVGAAGHPRQVNLSWAASDDEIRFNLAGMFAQNTRLILNAHGFGANSAKSWNRALTDALFKRYAQEKLVVMLIDWRNGANWPLYNKAAANVQVVGRLSAHWVKRLQRLFPGSIAPENIHFIGFSLGGQMSGYFARDFYAATKTKVGRVTALDTAGPLFEDKDIYPRRGEAEYIEALHTSAGGNILYGQLGVKRPYADVDYYPNGGTEQPGCSMLKVACNHKRAYLYYIAALLEPNCQMNGPSCLNVQQANEGSCHLPPRSPFLGNLRRLLQRLPSNEIVFFKTSADTPYCLNKK